MESIIAATSKTTLGLSNHFLFKTLKKDLQLNLFDSVYSSDTVPIKKLAGSKPLLCIVNCSPSNKPGTHFVCLLVRKKDILVLDSLALPLEIAAPNLLLRLQICGKKITHAFDKPLQNALSAFCGIYCMYFCLYISKRDFPRGRRHLKSMSTDREEGNDKTVLHNLLLLIRSNPTVERERAK